jgi:hypothetical protein
VHVSAEGEKFSWPEVIDLVLQESRGHRLHIAGGGLLRSSLRGEHLTAWSRHDGANHHDMKLLEATLASTPIARPIPTIEHPQGLCLDRGYDYQAVRELVTLQRFEPHICSRGEELAAKIRDPNWRPKRWVVEASHSWLNRNRGILIRWSRCFRFMVLTSPLRLEV